MIAALVINAYILGVCYLYGWLVARLAVRWLRINPADPLSPTSTALLGLCAVVTLAAALSLFMPLGARAQVLLLVGALWIGLSGWNEHRRVIAGGLNRLRSLSGALWVLSVLVMVTILSSASLHPANPDTAIYHAQAIRWSEQYGVVPGLGNLHSRFAYNSNWLIGTAIFSFAFLKVQSFRLLTSAFFLLVSVCWLGRVNCYLQRRAEPSDTLAVLLLPISFAVLGSQISSSGTDLPVTLLIWVLAIEWMKVIEEGETAFSLKDLFLFALAVFAITVKLSALPLLLLAIVVWRWALKDGKRLAFLLVLAASAVLAPWVARTAVLSGYLIYPLYQLDLLRVDWKMPGHLILQDMDGIRAWAREPVSDFAATLARPFLDWAASWYHRLTFNRQFLFLMAAFSPLIVALSTTLRWRSALVELRSLQKYLPVITVLYLGGCTGFSARPTFASVTAT